MQNKMQMRRMEQEAERQAREYTNLKALYDKLREVCAPPSPCAFDPVAQA